MLWNSRVTINQEELAPKLVETLRRFDIGSFGLTIEDLFDDAKTSASTARGDGQ